jgi:peroxiredoxin
MLVHHRRKLITSLAFITLACLPLQLQAAGLKVGDQAADFSLNSRTGETVSMSSLKGQVVLLNFWASWCGPCRQEFPLLDTIHKKYRKLGFTVVGLNVEPDAKDAEAFLKQNPVSFPIVYDPNDDVSKRYGIGGMPSVALIDRKGIVRWMHKSYVPGDENEYMNQVRILLAEK